jgi:LPXTG-site transpeptidase (sortase) family protein
MRVDLPAAQESHTMAALSRNTPSYWRIVSQSGESVTPSETRAFVPCGGPFLLWGPLQCRNFASASVNFRWAPAANFAGEQWIEFDSDGDWDGDDFWRAGPFSPGQETVRRSGFLDGVGYLFRVVREVGELRQVSSTGWFQPDCTPEINPNAYGSDDRLLVPSIGVDAPINVRDVGYDAVLGVPIGANDVVRYEFKAYPHLAGRVGGDGPKVLGGHLDFYIGPAVFWDLAKVKAGDTIRYQDGNQTYTYIVDWVGQVPFYEPLNAYIEGANGDEIFLITCYGVFDRLQFGGYNERTIVHGLRQ